MTWTFNGNLEKFCELSYENTKKHQKVNIIYENTDLEVNIQISKEVGFPTKRKAKLVNGEFSEEYDFTEVAEEKFLLTKISIICPLSMREEIKKIQDKNCGNEPCSGFLDEDELEHNNKPAILYYIPTNNVYQSQKNYTYDKKKNFRPFHVERLLNQLNEAIFTEEPIPLDIIKTIANISTASYSEIEQQFLSNLESMKNKFLVCDDDFNQLLAIANTLAQDNIDTSPYLYMLFTTCGTLGLTNYQLEIVESLNQYKDYYMFDTEALYIGKLYITQIEHTANEQQREQYYEKAFYYLMSAAKFGYMQESIELLSTSLYTLMHCHLPSQFSTDSENLNFLLKISKDIPKKIDDDNVDQIMTNWFITFLFQTSKYICKLHKQNYELRTQLAQIPEITTAFAAHRSDVEYTSVVAVEDKASPSTKDIPQYRKWK